MYETAVYYMSDDAFARISTNEIKWKNWAHKMAEEHPQEVRIQSESESYLVSQFPKRYLKLSPPHHRRKTQGGMAGVRQECQHERPGKPASGY